ncbi:hypothetical protein D3C78_1733580 [compost metagenome]
MPRPVMIMYKTSCSAVVSTVIPPSSANPIAIRTMLGTRMARYEILLINLPPIVVVTTTDSISGIRM